MLAPRSLIALIIGLTLVVTQAALAKNGTESDAAKGNNDTSAADKIPRVPYDKIEGMPERIPANVTGRLYKKYQPYWYINGGCQPYAAINAKGELSSGLGIGEKGSDEEACSKPKMANIYVRSGFHGKGKERRFAIMFTIYMPRDGTWTTEISKNTGHIYDFEQVIVWLSDETEKAKLLAVSPSGHGGFENYAAVEYPMQGTHPLVSYGQQLDHVRNHQLLKGDEDDVGKPLPMVAWTEMTPTMRKNLNTPKVWNGCTSGVVDAEFGVKLAIAAPDVEKAIASSAFRSRPSSYLLRIAGPVLVVSFFSHVA